MSYLVPQQPRTFNTTIRKFEPAFMDVDFDISAVATVVTTGPNAFTLKGILRELSNLVGLFWRSKDKWGHPLYSYEQDSDWSNCTWAFDLTYTNCPTINDAANGGLNRLTMTVTDLSGKPYFVYLQNYMTAGSPSSRTGSFRLPFPNVFAGILADGVIPWDFIDNVFIGFVPPGYTPGSQTPLTPEVEFEAVFTNVSVTGTNSTVGYNNAGLPAHDLYIADGYADSYPMTPARVVEQIVNLGYRGQVVLYVGFTQFLSLTWNAGESRFIIDTAKPTLNVPTQQWVTDFCARLAARGVAVIISVSFELLKEYCPLAWAQYDWKGQQSESGWSPSSTFVSPSSVDGMNYLRDVAVDFVGLSVAAGATTLYQVGEPWWWAGGFRGDGPCFYDTYARAEYLADTGNPVPTPFLRTIYDDYSSTAQTNFLLWLENKLGEVTTWLKDEVKAAYPGTQCTVLFYTPTISNPLAPMLTLVNFPQARWSSPEWDFIQVEDYEVIEFGNFDLQRSDLDVPIRDLGYTAADCQYFSGFNLLPATTFIWDKIDKAIWQARALKGYPEALVWARPQVCRDGWVYNQDDWPTYAASQALPTYPVFPVLSQLGWSVLRSPVFNTLVSLHASGKEIRSPRAVYPRWEFTLRYEGLKSDGAQSFQALLSFFQSMKGRGNRFAFTDPENNTVTAGYIGTGDGFRTNFTLCRSVGLNYEEPVGFINSLMAVYVNGSLVGPGDYQLWYNNGITNNTYPQVLFDTPVADGAVVTADFSYYFLCRFYDDTMTFEEFMKNFHEASSVKFITVKP
jgi:uncharacterized protein (TIGR02217 family)